MKKELKVECIKKNEFEYLFIIKKDEDIYLDDNIRFVFGAADLIEENNIHKLIIDKENLDEDFKFYYPEFFVNNVFDKINTLKYFVHNLNMINDIDEEYKYSFKVI